MATQSLWPICVLDKQYKLGHNDDWLMGNQWFYATNDGFHFSFQRMSDKVKDRLVLSAIWQIGVERHLE